MVLLLRFHCSVIMMIILVLLSLPVLGRKKDDGDQNQRSTLLYKNRSLSRVIATAPGSKPPSCLNKCDSCTPCQAVQAVQDASNSVVTDMGSRPPSCQNKCNRCLPCQAVQVPTPDPKDETRKQLHRKAPPVQPEGEINVQYSNYKPKGWRCQCGNKLFNP